VGRSLGDDPEDTIIGDHVIALTGRHLSDAVYTIDELHPAMGDDVGGREHR